MIKEAVRRGKIDLQHEGYVVVLRLPAGTSLAMLRSELDLTRRLTMNVLISRKLTPLFILFSLLNFFVACGSNDDDDGDSVTTVPPQSEEQQDDPGTYQAILTPLNLTAAGSSKGEALIRIRGDEVKIDVDGEKTPRRIIHWQHVHVGGSCPTPLNDINQDGFIDYVEAQASTGKILIPLDSDLSSQAADGVYPVSNHFGNYFYDEETSLARMLADLRAPDPVPGDDLVKLDPSDNLNLAGRAVMVHGVSRFFPLPATVTSQGGAPAHRTLPIACGVLVRVADSEEVPPPVPVPTPTPPVCPDETAFSTRISNNLLIGGVRCQGGETTEVTGDDGTTRIFVCREGQWLVTVDNVNTCIPGGGCTEVGVLPVISSLNRTSPSDPPRHCSFNINPISPISGDQRDILEDHQVRFFQNRDPIVIPKNNP